MIVVDRIEDSTAVLLIGNQRVSLPLELLPPETQEGTHLAFTTVKPASDDDTARLNRLRAATTQDTDTYNL